MIPTSEVSGKYEEVVSPIFTTFRSANEDRLFNNFKGTAAGVTGCRFLN
jgi:hypothetical protein